MPTSPNTNDTANTPSPAHKAACAEAQTAILRWKASRDPADKIRAAEKLWLVMLVEAEIIAGARIDKKLPLNKRRDPKELANNAVASVFASPTKHFTLLAEKFDPTKANLRTYVSHILFSKLMDYVRKEPIPGLIGRDAKTGKIEAAPTLSDELAADTPNSTAAQNTLAHFAATLAPEAQYGSGSDDVNANANAPTNEPLAEDDHSTNQLLRQITRYLTTDEQAVFICEFQEMTHEEGVEAINNNRLGTPDNRASSTTTEEKNSTSMTITQYRQLLMTAQAKLTRLFPEHSDTALHTVINTQLTAAEAEVYLCNHQGMTNDAGLAHLCALHGEREGPDGKMYAYMSLSTYKRKLESAREILVQHLPNYKL